jgi:excinuclease UvrABC nuclease subunit
MEVPPSPKGPIKMGRPRCREAPPAAPGVYRWIDRKTGKAVYIGMTKDLSRRPKDHTRKDWYDPERYTSAWQPANEGATSMNLGKGEKHQIKRNKPRYNRNAGGGGPRW